jgi:hypothetical protein
MRWAIERLIFDQVLEGFVGIRMISSSSSPLTTAIWKTISAVHECHVPALIIGPSAGARIRRRPNGLDKYCPGYP